MELFAVCIAGDDNSQTLIKAADYHQAYRIWCDTMIGYDNTKVQVKQLRFTNGVCQWLGDEWTDGMFMVMQEATTVNLHSNDTNN